MIVPLTELRCVVTGQRLCYLPLAEWPDKDQAHPIGFGKNFNPVGLTGTLVVTEDRSIAYPVVNGVPVMVAPEAFAMPGVTPARDVNQGHYAEAYLETALYSAQASDGMVDVGGLVEVQALERMFRGRAENDSFPDPTDFWLRPGSTISAQRRAFKHLSPVSGEVGMQLGGWGYYALLLLAGGVDRAFAVSPFPAELRLGQAAAKHLGVAARFLPVAAFAEEMPFVPGVVSRIYSPGSIHHTDTSKSFQAVADILAPGGRFSSLDVWKAPLHGIGTKVFGKCHGNIYCRPLEQTRVAPVHQAFDDVSIALHGAMARYPLAIAERLNRFPSIERSLRWAEFEDRMAARSEWVRKQSSVITICAEKA